VSSTADKSASHFSQIYKLVRAEENNIDLRVVIQNNHFWE
jgi:hypothetical protein